MCVCVYVECRLSACRIRDSWLCICVSVFYELPLLRSLYFIQLQLEKSESIYTGNTHRDCVFAALTLHSTAQCSTYDDVSWVAGVRHWHVMLRYVSICCCHRRRHHHHRCRRCRRYFVSLEFTFDSLPMQTSTYMKSDDAKTNIQPTDTHNVLK